VSARRGRGGNRAFTLTVKGGSAAHFYSLRRKEEIVARKKSCLQAEKERSDSYPRHKGREDESNPPLSAIQEKGSEFKKKRRKRRDVICYRQP